MIIRLIKRLFYGDPYPIASLNGEQRLMLISFMQAETKAEEKKYEKKYK